MESTSPLVVTSRETSPVEIRGCGGRSCPLEALRHPGHTALKMMVLEGWHSAVASLHILCITRGSLLHYTR